MKLLKITTLAVVVAASTYLTGCSDAQVASSNLSKASDMFEINRRVIFYNGITDDYMLTIEGKCSIHATKTQLEVTCKTGSETYKKHFLGISDNVTYFVEQLEPKEVSVYNYRVIFKPDVIVPDIDFESQLKE
jgi:hypothetical protein